MAVENAQVVDAVGTDIHTGEVVLSLIDASEWGGQGHLLALQTKLNSYFGFVESGQLIDDYPNAQGKGVRIDVTCKFEPDAAGIAFLSNARDVATGANWKLSWKVV